MLRSWLSTAPCGRAGGRPARSSSSLLRGDGAHGRSARLAGRLVRVLAELELVSLDRDLPALAVREQAPTALERSPAYRVYAQGYEDGQTIPEQRKPSSRRLSRAIGRGDGGPSDGAPGNGKPAEADGDGLLHRSSASRSPAASTALAGPRGEAAVRERRALAVRAAAARRPVRDRRGARRPGRCPIDRDRVEEAFVYACVHHADQRRQSGEDFIIHPVGVAKICAGMRLDTETLCAALLHDTVEDTSASLEEVQEAFGEEIAGPGRRRHQARPG